MLPAVGKARLSCEMGIPFTPLTPGHPRSARVKTQHLQRPKECDGPDCGSAGTLAWLGVCRGYPFLAKPPAIAEHITVARDTHDPLIYMDTFFRFFDRKPCVLNGLK